MGPLGSSTETQDDLDVTDDLAAMARWVFLVILDVLTVRPAVDRSPPTM